MPSSLIGVLQRHCEGIDSACPDPEPSQFASLAQVLDRIPDPRRVRGRRYRLGSLLALCLVAVLGGATSLAAISRFAADTASGLRERLGLISSTPNASTLGRLLSRLDGDALDDTVGAWLARYAADPVDEPGDRLVGLAVDGKTVRGSRTDSSAVHLLAAALHSCQTVIAQRQVAAKSNEIPALSEDRGFPDDASDGLRGEFAGYGGPHDVHGTTWLTWAELDTTDWQETDTSGTRTRASAAGTDTDWGRVWSVMRILSEVHGAENVRLVVWFH